MNWNILSINFICKNLNCETKNWRIYVLNQLFELLLNYYNFVKIEEMEETYIPIKYQEGKIKEV
jgi:hypothetical protein